MKKLFVAIAFIAASCIAQAQPPIGSVPPDISLPDVNGNIVKLSSLKGKVVLLDFWASWCGPCRRSNHEMVPVYNKYKDKGLEVYAISIDADELMWMNAIQKDKMTWLNVNDKKGARGDELLNTWAVRFIPATFIIDRLGVLRASIADAGEAKKWIKKLL